MVEGYSIENFWPDGKIVTLGRDVNRDGLLQNKEGMEIMQTAVPKSVWQCTADARRTEWEFL